MSVYTVIMVTVGGRVWSEPFGCLGCAVKHGHQFGPIIGAHTFTILTEDGAVFCDDEQARFELAATLPKHSARNLHGRRPKLTERQG